MNTNNIAVTITGSGKITAVIEGIVHTIDTTHPNYANALQCVKDSNWQGFLDAVDLTRKVKDYFHNSDVQIIGGAINYKGEVIHNTLTDRVIKFMQQDLPFKPLLSFLSNLMENPSKRAVDELYNFLEVGELPITEDGYFLAFKNVKSDYKDIHSGTFDNSVGKVCEMRRNQVDEDKDRTCSYGLHFCSIAYLPNFSDSNGGHTMIVKINPKDVVAIPADYNNTKGRTCRYEVIGEYTDDWRSKLGRGENGFDSDLYSSDGGEYEEDEHEYCSDCQNILNVYDDQEEGLCNPCVDRRRNEKGEDLQCSADVGDECCGNNCCHEKPLVCGHCSDPIDNYEPNTNLCKSCAEYEEKSYGKPTPTPYHNVRDDKGRFTKKEVTLLNAIKEFFKKD